MAEIGRKIKTITVEPKEWPAAPVETPPVKTPEPVPA